jgi:hypothetical protein
VSDLKNPLLRAAVDQIESQLTPEIRDAYLRVVVAGTQAGLDKGPDGILASLKLSKDPISDAAKGAVNLALMLRKHAEDLARQRGNNLDVMPLNAMVLAAYTLMFTALDYIDRIKLVAVGKPELDRAAHVFTNTLYAGLGITPKMLVQATQRAHAAVQNPAIQAKMNLKAGVTSHPNVPPPPPPGARTPLMGMPAA